MANKRVWQTVVKESLVTRLGWRHSGMIHIPLLRNFLTIIHKSLSSCSYCETEVFKLASCLLWCHFSTYIICNLFITGFHL